MRHTIQSLRILALLILVSYFPTQVFAQTNAKINFAVGLSATYAPILTWDHRQTRGAFFSIFGDLQIDRVFFGRLQFSGLVPSTLSDPKAENVIGGYSANGSLGYNLIVGDTQLEIPLMATLGLAQISWEEGGYDWADYGMQVGVTISPQYYIRDRISLNATLRYLKGLEVANGGVFDQLDFSLGARFTIF